MSLFITFEGIEGSGKTTQIKILDDFLKLRGHPTCLTREPGGTQIGDEIRHILLHSKNQGMGSLCELLLYAAARAQHIQEIIQPALQAQKIVLCDRFVDATIAYQGYARKIPMALIDHVNQVTVGSLKPDLTFLFDCDPSIGLKRAWERISHQEKSKSHKEIENPSSEDRFEKESLDFHQKVREGYLALAQKEPERFIIIDAASDVETIHQEITKQVLKLL